GGRMARPETRVEVAGDQGRAGIRADLVVADLAPARAQLQRRNSSSIAEERLFLQVPTDGERRKRAVAIVRAESGGAVDSQRSREEIAIQEAVVRAEQVGEHLPVESIAEVGLALGVAGGAIPEILGRADDAGALAADRILVVRLRGDARQQVEAVAIRHVVVGDGILPQPRARRTLLDEHVGNWVLLRG